MELGDALRFGAAGLILFGALVGTLEGLVPAWLPAAYLMLGAVSFAVYGFDKRAARRGDWRVTEGSLHGIDLMGGVSGGLLAQLAFRHKTRKQSFVAATTVIAVSHLALLASLLLRLWTVPPALFFI